MRSIHLVPSLLLIVVLALFPAQALALDADVDGLDDAWEQGWFGSFSTYDGYDDPDHDGLDNAGEQAAGSDPTHMDSDEDGLLDGVEVVHGTDPTAADSDGDGLSDLAEIVVHGSDPTDPADPPSSGVDTDGDGLTDAIEAALGTDPDDVDSDGDWLEDGEEDADQDGSIGADETDPRVADSDGDGLHDGWEVEVYGSDPAVADSDGDGLDDADEHALRYGGHLCLSPVEADSDFDGLDDLEEVGGVADPCSPDSDEDGLLDAVEVADGSDPLDGASALPDSDGDGLSDSFEAREGSDPHSTDSDGDGLGDAQERFPLDDGIQTDPADVDSDDDGLIDSAEGGRLVAGELVDGSDPSVADSDGDHLQDGLEWGLEQPQRSDAGVDGTDRAVFRPDHDPSTTTDPLVFDSDGDGLGDGREDADHDGLCDAQESCPELYDSDGDGMHDGWESRWSSSCAEGDPLDPADPTDASVDGDGDGLSALDEYRLLASFGDRPSPCAFDSDGDGLGDGLEAGASYGAGPSSPVAADSDGDGLPDGDEDADGSGSTEAGSETDPTVADSDGDGLADGEEDLNGDGSWDPGLGETDPLLADTDGDGLSDGEERLIVGTDPLNSDTDGDGLSDGLEAGREGDTDPSSRTDPLASDSDGDGLLDGEEDPDGDGAWDSGETHPMDADTDGGGVSDGVEVLFNGTDPLDPSDDVAHDSDGDGLDDDVEQAWGTDPYDVDSDGDGLWDGLELGLVGDSDPLSTTDPILFDSDGDGLSDGAEDADGDGMVDGSETDPADEDSDGEGLSDGFEIDVGLDPLDQDSDGDTIRDDHEASGHGSQPPDTDRDGRIDALDDDSDGDTVDDAEEAGDDALRTPPVDSDLDGSPDYRDQDSDDGGVDDGTEQRVHATDRTDPSDDGRGWLEDGGQVVGGSVLGCSSGGRAPLGALWLTLLAVPVFVTRTQTQPAQPRGGVGYCLLLQGLMLVILGIVAVLVSALLPRAAHAGVEHPDAHNTALDANPFLLDPAGLGVLSTGSGRVLGAMELRGGLTLQQVERPVVVAGLDDGELLRALVDDRRQLDVAAAMGLGKGVELSMVMPVVLHQAAENPGQKLGEVASSGVGDLRLRVRLALAEGRRGGLALALPVVLPTGDSEAWMGTGLPAFEPALQGSLDLGPVELASAVGYRVQQRSSLFTMVDGHKLTARAGARYRQPMAPWAVATEAWMSTRAGAPLQQPGETAAEALLAGSWLPDWGLEISGGVGAGLAAGVGAPAWRGLVSVSWGANTRPDADKDGVPISRDRCPTEPEDWDSYRDDDGCPDPDDDGDGLGDLDDACPLDAEDFDGFEDDDGCPEEGPVVESPPAPEEVADVEEPVVEEEEPEDAVAMIEEPAEPLGPTPAEILAEIQVHFAFGSTEPDLASEAALERVLELLAAEPGLRLVLEGHTDDVGSAEGNQAVSERRARAVQAWLVARGGAVLAQRVAVRGHGEARPAVPNDSDAHRAQNRRVEVVLD
jgi:large repetitive protein